MIADSGRHQDGASGAYGGELRDGITIRGHWRLAYYAGEVTAEQIERGEAALVEEYEGENLLVNAGIQLLWDVQVAIDGASDLTHTLDNGQLQIVRDVTRTAP
jgi:hypothetical protein